MTTSQTVILVRKEEARRGGPSMPQERPTGAPPYFHVLAKPTGSICNLDCEYCFFLSKEALYPGDRFRMTEGLLETYIRQIIEAQAGSDVTIAWQGGEPTLMGLGFFEHAVELAESYRRPDQTLHHTIQTNGTLLTPEWCQFLSERDFLVGLSVDGPRELHDAYRVDKKGRPSFDRVMRGHRLLVEYGVEFNVLCTVHAANQQHPLDVYRFFRDELGAKHVQFIPIVEREEPGAGTQQVASVSSRTVDPVLWGQFLVAVFDEWLVRDVGTVFVQAFDAALASWLGLPPGVCVFAETCGNAVAMEHNGDVYCCDHFVEPDYLLGNVSETHLVELVASPRQREFGAAKRDALPRYCQTCEVRFACNGECPKNRFIATPDGEAGLNYLCRGYKTFFTHIDGPMRVMANLLRRGHDAPEIMDLFARANRNDPCPCGSGRKAKLCHQTSSASSTESRGSAATATSSREATVGNEVTR
jgi:uncharacterized protein